MRLSPLCLRIQTDVSINALTNIYYCPSRVVAFRLARQYIFAVQERHRTVYMLAVSTLFVFLVYVENCGRSVVGRKKGEKKTGWNFSAKVFATVRTTNVESACHDHRWRRTLKVCERFIFYFFYSRISRTIVF